MDKDMKAGSQAPSGWDEISKMTSEELRRDLVDQGLDPDAEIAALRRLGRVMAAKYAAQIERESRLPSEMSKSFPIFADAVAAGQPAWAAGREPDGQGSLLDVLGQGSTEDTFWARVSGWSMRGEGINDGDLVLVSSAQEAKDGDMVLAHLEGEGQVVKRLRASGAKLILESANPDFPPIVIEDPRKLRIHGVVVGRAGKV